MNNIIGNLNYSLYYNRITNTLSPLTFITRELKIYYNMLKTLSSDYVEIHKDK